MWHSSYPFPSQPDHTSRSSDWRSLQKPISFSKILPIRDKYAVSSSLSYAASDGPPHESLTALQKPTYRHKNVSQTRKLVQSLKFWIFARKERNDLHQPELRSEWLQNVLSPVSIKIIGYNYIPSALQLDSNNYKHKDKQYLQRSRMKRSEL